VVEVRSPLPDCPLDPMSNPLRSCFIFLTLATASNSVVAQNPIYGVPGRATSIAGLRDVDLDGKPDFIVGKADGPGPGIALVYSGRTGLVLFTIHGNSDGDQLGYAVCDAGDVDGDGHTDFAIGANAADIGASNAGLVRMYSGASGAQLWEALGVGASADAGASLASIGDVDLDGVPDLAVGSPYENHSGVRGSVRVYSGASGTLLLSVYGTSVNDVFGCSVAAAGDLDGDGRADFVVGANQSTLTNPAGYAQVISGGTGSVLFTFNADAPGDWFGSQVAGGADVNGDGIPDILVSAPQAGLPQHLGMVRAFSGVNGSVLHTFRSLGYCGISLALIGDVNFDGAADYVAGEPNSYGGRVVVISGRTGHCLYRIPSVGPSDFLGRCVAAMPDLNGDGVPEFMAGAPAGSIFGSGLGYVRIYSGMNRPPASYCVSTPNSAGCLPTIGFFGVPTGDSDDNFRIQASQVLNNTTGLLVLASAPAALPFHGGTLCVQGTLVRCTLQGSGGSASGDDCSGTFDFAVHQSYLHAHGWNTGASVYAQWWSRDRGLAAPNNVSLTDGLAFVVAP